MKEPFAVRITVTGLVQGVGFRAFVSRIARAYGLSGWVRNTNDHVEIFVQGPPDFVRKLLSDLRENPPSGAVVEEIISTPSKITDDKGFRIRF